MQKRTLLDLKSWPLPYLLLLILLTLLVGFGTGYQARSLVKENKEIKPEHFAIRSDGYRYISPLLDCENALDSAENSALEPFEHKVKELLVEYSKTKAISSMAVYFRDLNNGPWFSFEPEIKFAPASLLKVPFLMAILKQAEADPEILKKQLLYSGKNDFNSIQNIKPEKKLRKGVHYTVEQLLHQMIIYSDNNASALLEDFFGRNILKEIHIVAGMPEISNNGVSVVEYARFYRLLYNASYLSRAMSEKALEIIAMVAMTDGLVTAIPSDIIVAHKFGEQTSIIDDTKELIQLHECGIVYYPERPYILCVMTKGNSFQELDEAIMQVSHEVYEGVNSQHLR